LPLSSVKAATSLLPSIELGPLPIPATLHGCGSAKLSATDVVVTAGVPVSGIAW
jgi:hypothetical protein